MAKKSPGQEFVEGAFFVPLVIFVFMFFYAWIVMLMWGAFVSNVHFVALPTIGYWAWFFGLNTLDWVASVAHLSLGISLIRIRDAIRGE